MMLIHHILLKDKRMTFDKVVCRRKMTFDKVVCQRKMTFDRVVCGQEDPSVGRVRRTIVQNKDKFGDQTCFKLYVM